MTKDSQDTLGWSSSDRNVVDTECGQCSVQALDAVLALPCQVGDRAAIQG